MKNLPRLLVTSFILFAVGVLRAEDKPAKPAAPAAPAPALSVAGTWNLQIQTDQGTGTPSFTFIQDGEKLTGQYKGMFGEAPVTGTLKGGEIKFSIKVSGQGQEFVIAYSGTVSGDTMQGTVKFGDQGEGRFTGKKQAAAK
jgi:hypothetical protein